MKERILMHVGRHLKAANEKAKASATDSEAADESEALQVAHDFLRDNFYNSYTTERDDERR